MRVVLEQGVKRWPKAINNQKVIIAFGSKPICTRYALPSCKLTVNTVLMLDLWKPNVVGLDLHRKIAARCEALHTEDKTYDNLCLASN